MQLQKVQLKRVYLYCKNMNNYIKIIGGLLALVFAYILYRQISQYFKDKKEFSSITEATPLKSNDSTVKRKKTDYQIASDAEALDNALLHSSGEDESTVERIILSYKSLNDWVELTKVFGVREDDSALKSFRGTLVQALQTYMSEGELDSIVKHLSYYNILI